MPGSTSSKKRWLFWTVLVVTGVAAGVAALLGFLHSAPLETRDTVDTILVLGVGLLVIGGSIFLVLRGLRRNVEAHNTMAAAHDQTLQLLARARGWQFREGYDCEHPGIGTLKGWGLLDGEQDGLRVRVGTDCESVTDGPNTITTVVIVKPPTESEFSIGMRSKLQIKRRRGRLTCDQLPVGVLVELEPIASLLTIEPDALTITLAPAPRFFNGMSYVLAVQTDIRIIESAIAASAQLAQCLLVVRPDLG